MSGAEFSHHEPGESCGGAGGSPVRLELRETDAPGSADQQTTSHVSGRETETHSQHQLGWEEGEKVDGATISPLAARSFHDKEQKQLQRCKNMTFDPQ